MRAAPTARTPASCSPPSPAHWPDGRFDLIVISEVAYYLDRADLARLVARVEGALLPEADIVLVHWLGVTHYPLSGDEAAEGFIAGAWGLRARS